MISYSAVIDDVDDDREVRVGEHHLELVSHGDSRYHVADGAADGADGGVALLLL